MEVILNNQRNDKKGKYCFDSKQKLYKFVDVRIVVGIPNVSYKIIFLLRKQSIKSNEIIDSDDCIELPLEDTSSFYNKNDALEMYYIVKS